MKTTFSRTLFPAAIILLAALLAVGASFQLLARNYLRQKAMDGLEDDCAVISHMAAAYGSIHNLSTREFYVNLSIASRTSGADAVICDSSGRLLICSDSPLGCAHQGMQITNKSFLNQLLSHKSIKSTGVIEGLYRDMRYVVASPIVAGNSSDVVGLVIVSKPTASTTAVLKELSDIYLVISLLVVAISVVIMTVYVRRQCAPLKDMAKTAHAFGHGALNARVPVREDSTEEIQELAIAFNNMAASLEKSDYQHKEFIANVSHELKTPMTTIGGYIDGILDGTIPDEKSRYYMQIVSDETKRLSRLVRSMLDISLLQDQGGVPDEKKEQFDVAECVGRTLLSFEQKITGKSLAVDVEMPQYPVFTFANEDWITQVIYNLLDNAIKFCPEGGALKLRVRTGGEKIFVHIANDGEPIPPDELPLVFERFHKLDKSRSQNRDSWGLGLYIVKTIICSHGENISVSSDNEKTEFTFTLPLAD